MSMGYYEEQQAKNLAEWRERRAKKEELYTEASRILETVGAFARGKQLPHEGYGWAAARPELGVTYAEALMKLGQYWDGTRLYEAVDTAADKIP
jgi:hypothetical protein